MEVNTAENGNSLLTEKKEKQNFINLLTRYTCKKGGTAYCGYRFIRDTDKNLYTQVWKLHVTADRELEIVFIEQDVWRTNKSRNYTLYADQTTLDVLRNVAYYLRGWPNVFIRTYESVMETMSQFYNCYVKYLNSEKNDISIYEESLSTLNKAIYDRYGTITQYNIQDSTQQNAKANLYSFICTLEKTLQQSRRRMGLEWSKTMN